MVVTIQILVALLAVVAAVAVVAARLEIPRAILLVLTGVILALMPGLPTGELAPELVLLLVLPAVIYSSAVAMSWSEFRFNLAPFLCWRWVASSLRPSRSPRRPIGCWVSLGR